MPRYAKRKSAPAAKSKSVGKRRRTNRKPRPKRAVVNTTRGSEAFPRVFFTKMRYVNFATGSTGATPNVAQADTYRANAPYDPYYALGGSSCQGMGTLMGIYGNMIAYACKINVVFNDPSGDGLVVGVRLRQNAQNATQNSSITALNAQPMTYVKRLNNTGKQDCRFSLYVPAYKLLAINKVSYMVNNEQYASATNAVPAADNCLFDVFYIAPNATSLTMQYTITIEYYCKFYNRLAI